MFCNPLVREMCFCNPLVRVFPLRETARKSEVSFFFFTDACQRESVANREKRPDSFFFHFLEHWKQKKKLSL